MIERVIDVGVRMEKSDEHEDDDELVEDDVDVDSDREAGRCDGGKGNRLEKSAEANEEVSTGASPQECRRSSKTRRS